jgi:hypothetical protein
LTHKPGYEIREHLGAGNQAEMASARNRRAPGFRQQLQVLAREVRRNDAVGLIPCDDQRRLLETRDLRLEVEPRDGEDAAGHQRRREHVS